MAPFFTSVLCCWALTLTLSHRERGQIEHELTFPLSPGERAGVRG